MKTAMRYQRTTTFETMTASLPVGVTQTVYRLCYLEEAIDEVMSAIISLWYVKMYNYVQKHIVPTLAQDLQMWRQSVEWLVSHYLFVIGQFIHSFVCKLKDKSFNFKFSIFNLKFNISNLKFSFS